MSFQEKNLYVTLFNSLVIFGVYYWWVSGQYHAGVFDGPDAPSQIGKSVLMLMAGGVVLQILSQIVFHIIYAAISGNPNPRFVVDERDKMIELRAIRISYFTMIIVFLLAMIALAIGWSLFAVFHVLVGGFAISALAEAVAQIIYYRRGY